MQTETTFSSLEAKILVLEAVSMATIMNDEKGICRKQNEKHPKIIHHPMAQHSQPLEIFQNSRKASVSKRLEKQSKNIPDDRKNFKITNHRDLKNDH